ncbi:MAG: Ppx/GppA family phosphatase [Chloroflexi bacterium]|nr:MAG: Ppx/GppA family phosphatase [Chloroflexota bacterium]MBL1194436.1 Ppx/GppA family phosphatase [Chloroflexota bacterium]NOH11724.1 Ppx/GppA family phosphatase [Chloroflexota bacterium]
MNNTDFVSRIRDNVTRAFSASAQDRTAAFIDMGTNSIRLLLVRIEPSSGTFSILSEQKVTIRLGENEFADHYLQPEAMQRAVTVCKQFAQMARSNDADHIIAIATSATREAKNQAEFVALLNEEAQIKLRTISGIEEARLIYLGISRGIHLEDKNALMIDIGGGSTELIVGDQDNHHHLDSLKLGAVRLGSMFFLPDETGPIDAARYAVLRQYVRNSSIRSIQKLEPHPFDVVYGSSGTLENLADIAIQMFEGRSRQPEDTLKYEQLTQVVEHLCELSLEERAKVPGINTRRADIIIPGAAIIHTLMEELGIPELHITERGLRDGLLVNYLQRSENAEMVEEGSVRMRSVLQLGRRCHFDEGHARTVADLSLSLFDSAKEIGLHTTKNRYRQLLEYSALLHDVGIFLSYNHHQEHSYYLIKNADLLGFDQTEIGIMASTAFFHRKKRPSDKHAQFKELDKPSREAVRVMAILLRIAESLDRSHKNAVTSASFRLEGGNIILDVVCEQDCQLEILGIYHHKKLFRKIFDREYEVNLISSVEQSAEVDELMS